MQKRKKLFYLVLLCTFFSTLFAYENTYYLHKKSQFKVLAKNKNAKIMMLGDSITDRGLWNELMQRCDVVNRGISGDTTEGVLHRLDTLNPQIKTAYIMIGINDILRGKSVNKIFTNYVKIIHILKSKKIIPIIESTLYVAKGTPTLYNKKVKKLNTLLKEYSVKNKLLYIDINAKLAPNGYLDKKYTLDGLHLNGRAYLVWVELIKSSYPSN